MKFSKLFEFILAGSWTQCSFILHLWLFFLQFRKICFRLSAKELEKILFQVLCFQPKVLFKFSAVKKVPRETLIWTKQSEVPTDWFTSLVVTSFTSWGTEVTCFLSSGGKPQTLLHQKKVRTTHRKTTTALTSRSAQHVLNHAHTCTGHSYNSMRLNTEPPNLHRENCDKSHSRCQWMKRPPHIFHIPTLWFPRVTTPPPNTPLLHAG